MKRPFVLIGMVGAILGALVCGCKSHGSYDGGNSIYFDGMNVVRANGNTPEAIRAEIVSDEFVSVLARRSGLSPHGVRRSFPIADVLPGGDIEYSSGVRPDLRDIVKRYIAIRAAGHSKTYAMARLESDPDPRAVTPDCRAILDEDKNVYLPWLWLYSFEIDGDTNRTTYVILDGELAWAYGVSRTKDRTLIDCSYDWIDAKDVLPQYRQLFAQVDQQIERDMKGQGIWNTLGSCHWYWSRKQELLKAQGVEWRSPPDLHPNTIYD